MTRERNPSTSALTLSGEIPFGLDWKKSCVTDTMFLDEALPAGSKEELASSSSAVAKRSLMASKGKGAVTCVDQTKDPTVPPNLGEITFHGLHSLS